MLGDGRIMTFSGADENSNTNTAVEIYTVWSKQYVAPLTPDLYPRMHLLPNGKVFGSEPPPVSFIFDPSSKQFTQNVATTNYGHTRTYGSSVLLPLRPANNYRPKVLILGGNSPATESTETIDLGASSPKWTWGPNMSQPRIENGRGALAQGKFWPSGAQLTTRIRVRPASMPTSTIPRRTVPPPGPITMPAYTTRWRCCCPMQRRIAGGNPSRGTYQSHMEIYKPSYLFTRDGNNKVVSATRPTIAKAAGTIAWGGSFTVSTLDAADISQVVLVRPGASTHAFDMDQRLVGMSFTAGSETLSITAPPNLRRRDTTCCF
jgi:hypothetical protein